MPEAQGGAGERLQKILAHAGVASRRASEQLIVDGRVTVNGDTVRTLGSRADPRRDDIRVDGRRIRLPETHRYLLLNKPRGYVTTRHDPEGRRTVMDLLRDVHEYLYPVGRLDYESEGLLLLTNDGDLAAQLMHPRHGVPRTYEVVVEGVLDEGEARHLTRGVVLDGRRTAPAIVDVPRRGRPQARTRFRITIAEGRNRQVRRMCEAVGHPVVELRRVRIGPISDERLRLGAYRDLRPDEVRALRRAVREGPTPAAPASRSAPAARPRPPRAAGPPRRA